MKTLEQLQQELDEKIPRSAVKERSGGGQSSFSYLSTDYVIDRLNKVLGNLSWDSETVEMVQLPTEKVSYRAKVRITATVQVAEGQYLKVMKEGTGYGADKNQLNPHEMASKEAESDALKRAAMKFGMSLGLALYSKDQENVEDAAPAGKPQTVPGTQTLTSSPKGQAATPQNAPSGTAQGSASTASGVSGSRPSAAGQHDSRPQGAPVNRDTLNKNISTLSKIILAQKKATQEQLIEEVKKHGADKKEDLSDEQAEKLFAALKGLAG